MAVGKESAVWATLVIAGDDFDRNFDLGGQQRQSGAAGRLRAVWRGDDRHRHAHADRQQRGDGLFGPITDNANGIAEMAGVTEGNARQTLADLDAVGNTTKAITKGVAIGSAVIAAVSLFGSFITDVSKIDPTALANGIRVSEPIVFIGFLIGGTIPWLFSSIAIKAVERAAGLIVNEVRRQFKDPGIMNYTKEPDYAAAVNICTDAAQRELLTLAIISVTCADLRRRAAGCRSPGRLSGRHHSERSVAGRLHVECRRRMGQRQEDHRR